MMDVTEIRARLAKKAEMDNAYAQAGQLFNLSANTPDTTQRDYFHEQGVQVAENADKLATAYYAQYPNCLSRNLNPWV